MINTALYEVFERSSSLLELCVVYNFILHGSNGLPKDLLTFIESIVVINIITEKIIKNAKNLTY